jgi:putative two-component system response regulator
VPDRILLKPSELTPEEYEIMKTHTTLGGDAIASAELAVGEDVGFLRLAKEIAYNHQERWDGSGYPRGLKGEEIPISARLMALADVYDALISKRVYKAAMTHQEAVQVIRDGRATKFDPDMVDVFLESENDIGEIANRHKDSAHTLVRQAERMIRDLGGEQIEM